MANFFIVGGSSGIGKKLAENLSAAGNQVFAT
jgi:short-subunit dehydrogenase involved in D-alanine esterification of teichoic acids